MKSFFQRKQLKNKRSSIKIIKETAFSKKYKKEINGLDIRKAIASQIWGDTIMSCQIIIESVEFEKFKYVVNFKIKSEGKTPFTIHLKYGKVKEKKHPNLRLL